MQISVKCAYIASGVYQIADGFKANSDTSWIIRVYTISAAKIAG